MTTACPIQQRVRGACPRPRAPAGPAAGRHQRRALPDARGRPGARHPALHQHRQDRRRPEPDAVRDRPVLRPQSPRRCTRRCRARRRPWPLSARDRRARRAELREPQPGQAPASPRSSLPGEKTPEDYLRELCEEGMRDAVRRRPAARGVRAARARAGHHQPDGVRVVLPDRLGLRPLRPRSGIFPPRPAARPAGPLVSYLLVSEPRLPAEVRPALRAVPRPEPLRGARYRHRLLQGAPRRGDRVRPARSTARPTWRRSARSARWRPRRRIKDVGRALIDPAGPRRSGHQARPREAATSRSRRRSRRSRSFASWPTRTPRSAGCSTSPAGSKGLARNVGTHAAGVVIADRPLDRPRAAPEAAQQGQGQGGHQHPVGDGRRREGRPAEDGLPRPAQPDEPCRPPSG